MAEHRIWFDCDTGVDDAIALLTAHRQPGLEIVGLSTVAGNVTLGHTTENTLKICGLMGADYPVYPGAPGPLRREREDASSFHGADGLGGAVLPAPSRAPEQTPAWDALYEAAARMPGELTLVATGPLTNAAIALTAHPSLRSLLRGIALMGGAAVGGNRTPCSEFNIHADPDAAEIVFSSGIPIIMCGLDVTEQAWFSPAEFAALPDTPVGRFARAATAGPMQKNMARGAGGLCLHDVCPVLYLTHPELFTGRQAGVHVETRGTVTYAKTVTDLDSDAKFPERNVFVVLGVDRAGFAAHITEALSSYAG